MGWDSWVLFKIDSEKEKREYRTFLSEILAKFIAQIDLVGGKELARSFLTKGHRWNGDEGGFRIHIADRFITCKLFLYDGEEAGEYGRNFEHWKGVLFRDHYTESDVLKVYLVADNFENFLITKRIQYARENMRLV